MCGITGIISKNKIKRNIIEPMTDSLIHRGPDGFGYYYGDSFVFGHRRLSIVDLSEAGHQPMEYINRYIMTFNGEIYNHIEIKNKLEENGYIFKSHTDTEVIMASYDFWGVDCLKHFNGMWAFVIYDKIENKYFMSRDRFGIKPFYYYKSEDTFIFASEIKGILLHPEVKIDSNIEYLNNYIKIGTREFTRETAFKNIYRLDFSSYFEGGIDKLFGNFKIQTFWELKPNLSHEKFDENKVEEYAQKYYYLLEDAVKIRLRADVKVGSALSGGLDSSSIVYLVNKLLKEQGKEELQETFSSVYKSKGTQDCDESQYIDIMADKLKVHSNQIEPNEEEIASELPRMIWHLENPPENSLMSSWYTFKLVSSTNVKVTLDGQGADEQLGGYLPYLMNYISSLSFVDMIKESKLCLSIPSAKPFVIRGLIIGISRIVVGEKITKFLIHKIMKKNLEISLNKKLVDDTMSNLITLIHYADHTSMAFSIESRMPFMDYRLVEYLASVPACYKMHNGWTKYLARVAFDGKLPDEINWRQDKMGWPIPEKKWFEGNLKEWFINKIKNCQICDKLEIIKNSNKSELFAFNIKKMNLNLYEEIFLNKGKNK